MTTTPREALRGSVTRLGVTRTAGRVRVDTEVAGDPGSPALRPMLLGSDASSARVCLVPDGAVLLAGDALRLEVVVGDGATLTLVEPTGTVAYNMDGAEAGWQASITLGDGATLVWAAEPFVVATGASVRRTTQVTVGRGARLALRETLVLGRHGERPGRGRVDWSAYDGDGRPLLVESLELDGRSALPGILGGPGSVHRVLGSVTALGLDLPAGAAPAGRLDLERGGTTWRQLAHDAHRLPAEPWDVVLRALDARAPGD